MTKLMREDVERIVREARERGERPRLRGANLVEANLYEANLSEVNLTATYLSRANLMEANLIEAHLSMADLSRANLSGANLSRTNLIKANFQNANLNEANLSGAYLIEADLSGTNLNEANLSKTYLVEANLSGTNLSEANLTEAYLRETALSNLDLRQPKGLETVNHMGPSHIDTHTLQRSQGQIPEIFLRGCGLSDWEIENAKLYNPNLTEQQIIDITYKISNLLTGDAIKYKSCFISYSHKDQAFAERIYTDLQNNGVRCWYAPEDMKIGDKIRHSIDQAIRLQDKLLLILSQHSVQSDWVGDEVEHALELEKERGELVLFPLRVDDTVLESKIGWAAKLKRDRHIGDFCGWSDDGAYQKGFKRLLSDLRAG